MAAKSIIIKLFAVSAMLLSTACTGDGDSKADRERRVGYDDCRVMIDSVFKKSFLLETRVTKLCTCMTIKLNKELPIEQSEMTKAVFKKASETQDLSAAILSEISLSGDELQSYKDTVEQTFATCEKKLQG